MKNNSRSHAFKLNALHIACVMMVVHTQANSQSAIVINDDFRFATATQSWNVFGGACLTAGSKDQAAAANEKTVPKCVGHTSYNGVTLNGGQTGKLPDAVGQGALRLTNNSNSQSGFIASNFTFPSNSGVAVTFNTVTYAGNGADGMTFFLADGSVAPNLGAFGGSLGYACSNVNTPSDGMLGAYLGLGMDEFGNFTNPSGNTSTGIGFQAGTISLRGAGNVNAAWLKLNHPTYYPASLSDSEMIVAVKLTCSTGTLWDYSKNAKNAKKTDIAIPNYNAIPNSAVKLPATTPLYTTASTRPTAKPVTYQLKITEAGLLSLKYSYNGGAYQSVLSNQSITASNGPLPATLRFGFTGATGGLNNIHEISCFRAEPATESSSSAGVTGQKTGEVKQGTQVLSAYYKPSNWTGTVLARDIVVDAITGIPAASSKANWDAGCGLTGGRCVATNLSNVVAQTSAARHILTWNGSTGVPFQYDTITAAQLAALTAGDKVANSNRISYLRGDRTNEVNSNGVGLFRARDSVMADVVNSSAVPVGAPFFDFLDQWVDLTNTKATPAENAGSAQAYSAFVSANVGRLNVAYVGANDGLLHGFRMGSTNSSGVTVDNAATPNDGKEVLAYMPSPIVDSIHNATTGLDYASPQYGHAFSVDATPEVGDVFYGGAWHTWLVGGLGAGGKGVYALDVTDPSRFSEANAASLVMGEWTPSSIICANLSNCGENMGNTYGTPQIRRFHNGMWGFVFGNGHSSKAGTAGIYVVTIDPATRATKAYFLSTSVGSAANPNGIAFAGVLDADSDHIGDFAYGGDLLGNVWRFDLTSSDPSNWKVSNYGNNSPTPLFSTPSGQPITTAVTMPIVLSTPTTGRAIISFGTGRLTPLSLISPDSFSSGQQTMYGVWDWDMAAWNKLTTGRQLFSKTGPKKIATTELQTQTITGPIADPNGGAKSLYTATANAVCWADLAKCTGTLARWGWSTALIGTQEQVISSPKLDKGLLTFNTVTPAGSSLVSCSSSINGGTTYSLLPDTGGAGVQSFYANSTGNFATLKASFVVGVTTGGTGSPAFVTVNKKRYVVTQDASGNVIFTAVSPPSGKLGQRVTWQQLR